MYHFSNKLDVFSFGILLWELLHAGRTPWEGVDDVEAATLDGHRPLISDKISNPWAWLMEACWHQNPYARPDFEMIESRLSSLKLD